MISTGELKKGVAIELDGELWQILDYHHIKMGRGSAQVRITLRNIKRGQTVERSFQAGTKWPRASMEKRPVQFLYRDGNDFHFMDNDTYDQFILSAEQLGETAQYLKDGMTLDRTSYQGETIGVELPVTVDLKVVETEPGLRRRHAVGCTQAGDHGERARSSRCRSSSSPATRSGSTPGPGNTRPGSRRPVSEREPPDWALPSWDAIPADPADRALRPVGPGVPATPARHAPSAPGTFGVRILGVSEVTRSIRGAVRSDPRLADLWVEGEIGRVTISSAGHAYFALKDERNQLQCVWFRDDRLRSAFEAQAGLRVVAHGRIDLFEPQGALQLYVESIQPAGLGDLTLRFEALKARLAAEGLFETSRKRPLPPRPATIAVITSPTGAVWKDICHVISRRWPLTRVLLVAAQVQGESAPASLVGAFRKVERYAAAQIAAGRPDEAPAVTILARGGGSLEDLWAFNDEAVVRAVVAHSVPVVCGVGHEVDVTLSDFAADVRAPTPSAAAEVVVPDRAEFLAAVRGGGRRLDGARRNSPADDRARGHRRASGARPAQPGGPARERAGARGPVARPGDPRDHRRSGNPATARGAARRPARPDTPRARGTRPREARPQRRPRQPCDPARGDRPLIAGIGRRRTGRPRPAGDARPRLRDRPPGRRWPDRARSSRCRARDAPRAAHRQGRAAGHRRRPMTARPSGPNGRRWKG